MDAKALFLEGFYQARAEFPDTPGSDIRVAGRPTKDRPRGEDETWWINNGPLMVQRWIDWRKASDFKLWTAPDGRPAIELELAPIFDGVPVKMVIDRVFVTPAGTLVVVDLKSGARTPESNLQLAFYAAGIRYELGVHVEYGSYWDARKGELSPLERISHLSPALIRYWVGRFVKAKQEGIYLPNITNKCRACGVNRYCLAYGGKDSKLDPDSERVVDVPF